MVGIGSPHGDDQLGWCVIDELSRDPTLQGVCTKVASPWDLVPYLARGGVCIVIDACRSGDAPGTIRCVAVQDLREDSLSSTSSHGGSVADAFRLAEALGYGLSGVQVYAIELEVCGSVTPVSASVRRGIHELAARIRRQLSEFRALPPSSGETRCTSTRWHARC